MQTENEKLFYSSSCGRIEIELTLDQAEKGSHSGDCEPDILELRQDPEIEKQLKAIDPDLLKSELRGFGAWYDKELSDHDLNLTRLLWIACGDISEEHFNDDGGE